MVAKPSPTTHARWIEPAFDAARARGAPKLSHRQFNLLLVVARFADDQGYIDVPPWERLQEFAFLGKAGVRSAFVRLVELGHVLPVTGERYRLACAAAAEPQP